VRLADFIIDQLDAILTEWESFARMREPAAVSMTSKELRNHVAVMLRSITDDLRLPQTSDAQLATSRGAGPRTIETEAGERHGIARLESRFSIEQLVAEYRALRASVLRLWSGSNKSPLATDIEDITRFNEAIDQLLAASVLSFAQAARQSAANEQRRRDEFLAMLAHELRNPLAPISAAATLLKMAESNEATIVNASNIIARQVAHMANLVEDLLDVSRVTRGQVKLKPELLDMRRIITDAVEQVTPQIEAHRHQLTVTEVPETAIVWGDAKRLVQVMANLLSNAAKYTPEGGSIDVRMALHDGQITLTVEDDGIGMTPEVVMHAFELFSQAERTSDRSSGGLGLGLALVKSLVELHGGNVTCSSAGPGKGSRFTVHLPLGEADGNLVERRRTSRNQLAAANRALKILLVDDNVDVTQALSLLLKAAGHEVITEHEAKRALETALTQPPDVCLLDIGLPEMNGNELARQLRAHPETARTSLIALTGYGRVQDREEAKAAGFDHHMTKPVDVEKLLAVLAALTPV
jgi:signal transduction histidine kinase/ActR/RegA family two-component response regulator